MFGGKHTIGVLGRRENEVSDLKEQKGAPCEKKKKRKPRAFY